MCPVVFLSIADWLQEVDDKTKAYCSYCKVMLRAHYKDLEKHCHTEKHKRATNAAKRHSSATLSKGAQYSGYLTLLCAKLLSAMHMLE